MRLYRATVRFIIHLFCCTENVCLCTPVVRVSIFSSAFAKYSVTTHRLCTPFFPLFFHHRIRIHRNTLHLMSILFNFNWFYWICIFKFFSLSHWYFADSHSFSPIAELLLVCIVHKVCTPLPSQLQMKQ